MEYLVSVKTPRTLEVLGWGIVRSLVAWVGSWGLCWGVTLMVLLTWGVALGGNLPAAAEPTRSLVVGELACG